MIKDIYKAQDDLRADYRFYCRCYRVLYANQRCFGEQWEQVVSALDNIREKFAENEGVIARIEEHMDNITEHRRPCPIITVHNC